MAKLTSRTQLVVGTNLTINEGAKTFTLIASADGSTTNGLIAKDGVTLQALYSKFSDLWTQETYQDSPFPMNAIDALSGQYYFGVDAGGNNNGWKPADDTTRNMLRDGGWREYSAAGVLLKEFAGFVGLGSINTGAQPYYQLATVDAPTNFPFDDQFNAGILVYEDAGINKKTYAKAFCREYGKKYKDSVLADTGKTGTGAFLVNFLISNEDDLKIQANDAAMTGAPYDNITVSYYTLNQTRDIGGTNRNFKIIIDGNNATLEQIYTKVQYLLRQDSDINEAGTAGTINGKTAASLLGFVGDTLETSQSVYVDNIQNADSNRIKFKDDSGIFRENPYTSAGFMYFNTALQGAGSSYRLMFTADSVTVKDATDTDITGVINSGSISFTFDYDNDTLGGTAGTDKSVKLVGIRPGSGKYAIATGLLTKSKALSFSLVGEADRAYSAA